MTILPAGPWLHARADFCGPLRSGETIIVVTDTHSRYPEVEIVTSTSAKSVLPAFDKIFVTHGIPEVIKTDNGPPFQGEAFRQFATEKGFHHHRITPRWPKANGQVENFMKNINKVIRTADICGKDWKRGLYAYLLNYCDTVHPSTGQSPYMPSFGRTIRTKIPTAAPQEERLQRQVQLHDQQAKARAKAYADESRGTAPHKFQEGDTVLVRQQKQNKLSMPFESKPYIVDNIKGSLVSAERVGDRRKITRNSSHFKKVNIDPTEHETYAEDAEALEIDIPDDTPADPENLQGKEKPVPVLIESDEARREETTRSRYGRVIKEPHWHKDYIV